MAILKTKYEKVDDIPEAHRPLFEQRGGSEGPWELTQIEGLETADSVRNLKEAARKEREARIAAEAMVKKFGDLDPDKAHAAIEQVMELEAQLAETGKKSDESVQKRIDAAVARALGPVERKLAAETARADAAESGVKERDARMTKKDIQSALRDAHVKVKAEPSALEDVLLRDHLFEIVDGKVVTRNDLDGVTPGVAPDVWLGDQRTSRPHWFPMSQGAGARGSNGNGAGGPNPFAKGSFNLSEAGRIAKADPSRATQLAKQAGFDSIDAAVRAGAASAQTQK
jgi:hypothetical protein